MLTGVDYDVVLVAFNSMGPFVKGVRTTDIKKAAKKCGFTLRFSRKVDLEHDTGILALKSKLWKSQHVVILKEGLIVDPFDACLWEYDVYLAVNKASVLSLLVKEDA